MKNAERLLHPCPQCQAKPGDPCKLYNGTPVKVPHRVRGPGQYESHLAKEAERRHARVKKSYGPLFEELAEVEHPKPTVEQLKEEKRRNAAFGVETGMLVSRPNAALEWMRVEYIRRRAAELIGKEAAEKQWVYARRVYDTKEGYIVGHFRNVLTSKTVVRLKLEKRYDPARANEFNKDGSYLFDAELWPAPDYEPPLTGPQFDAMFPSFNHWDGLKDAPEPDDGGLFDRVMLALGVRN